MSNGLTDNPKGTNPDLEAQRLQSEIARNRAEERKLQVEAAEIDKRVHQKWYSGKIVGQVIATFVAALLIAWWVIGVIEPLLDAKSDETELAFEIESHKLTLQLLEVEAENTTLLAAQIEAESLLVMARRQFDNLRSQYVTLARMQQLTERQRTEYTRQANAVENTSKQLDSTILSVRVAQDSSTARLNTLNESSKRPELFRIHPFSRSRNMSPAPME